eukprot:GCRY01001849.1.p1 GENE.GCRY01001849.1~~GCRY01001849.1.p1  ORF type:complete len:137 (-),score=8.55 GCRY01001849.1:170-580(-)
MANQNDVENGILMEEENEENQKSTQYHTPFLGKVTIGLLTGFCAGVACRKIGKAAAFSIGVGFMGLQYLQHKGFIVIRWGRVNEILISKLDQNGDGQIDQADLKTVSKGFFEIMKKNLPASSGFAGGFALGVKGRL